MSGSEAALREILQVMARSRDDETPVFETILENACRLCHADIARCSVADWDSRMLRFRAQHGGAGARLVVGENQWPLDSPQAIAIAVCTGTHVHVPDLRDTDLYRSGDPTRVGLVDGEGIRSVLAVPLIGADRPIGVIAIHRRRAGAFSPGEIALVETFAAQAVIAIENVRQFRELQERLEREAATAEVLNVISRSRDDDGPVFEAILEASARLCESPTASLLLLDGDGTCLVFRSVWGEPFVAFRPEETRFDMASDLVPVQAVREGRTIHIADMSTLDSYRRADPVAMNTVDVEGIRTFLVVPLILNGEAIGCINLFRREVRPFDERQVGLVAAFAAQAVIAIENVRQFRALEARTAEVQALNASLEARVAAQVGEIERMGRLKRFLPAAVADTVVSSGSEKLLESHRALLGVLFCDIRGFTAFCETAEPEETIEVLQTYHEEMGRLIGAHGAGVDHRMGDGIMVLFNDPIPCDDPAADAVRLAIAMRERMAVLCARWKRLGHRLGFGVGVSLGYATVGMVGFEGRFDYTASGTAVNLAARLCDEAEDGEILLSPRAGVAVEDDFRLESRGEMALKGIQQPLEILRLIGPAEAA